MNLLSASMVWLLMSAPCLCMAFEVTRFDPDIEPSRVLWSKVDNAFGPLYPVRGRRFGIIVKTMTNEYWRMMATGYRRRAAFDGVKLDIQASVGEDNELRQLVMMQNMVGGGYSGILISPESSSNLQPAIDDADKSGVPVVDVDGAVVDSIKHFVGPVNRKMGVLVANWFLGKFPQGGKVAVIEGLPNVYSSIRRSAGFRETLLTSSKFEVVASVSGRWDRGVAYDAALKILATTPDLIGFYCNNDTMALAVVEAVKSLNLLSQVRVFGSDGTREAYRSIRAGEMAGTVDIFPMLTGDIGLEIMERLVAGQVMPRVIETPQALITLGNITLYEKDYDKLKKMLSDQSK